MIQQNNYLENQDIKSKIIIKETSKEEINLQSENQDISFHYKNQTSDQFYLILQQAIFELIHRIQLEEVHKILRDFFDQTRFDMLNINKVLSLVQNQHPQAIFNYQQFKMFIRLT
ncbi:unnamed protein product [Paramecium pentaurelia]|uniref:Uncharacterized protein n=1 Tax=Paramecium pentaurelia TaxID=43138 RepID=A0A8S1XTP5_9CILI|nr:unnamed protein product [Paramecium pentaurelia]